MTTQPYLRPSWGVRVIGNRMARIFARRVLSDLSVPGRRTGRWRTVPVAVLEHHGQRYLIAPWGNTEWSRNLRAAGTARLTRGGRTEEFEAVEVPAAERPPLIEVYLERFGRYPHVAPAFRELPDPANHPTFRILRSSSHQNRGGPRRPHDTPPNRRAEMTTRKSRSTIVKLFAAGLIAAGIGFTIQYLAGVPGFPKIPPGPFILIGAGLLVIFVHGRWAIVVGVIVALSLIVGSAASSAAALDRLTEPGDIGPFTGTVLQGLGLITALVFGVATAAEGRGRRSVTDGGRPAGTAASRTNRP
jgi:deazaflavin-dependent oxidoreductase (nitroreductase family)